MRKYRPGGTAIVAGRPAYELVLRPRDPSSLVSSVRIAIDGSTHIPTRVQVYGTDTGKPALEVGFTSFDPTSPDATVFRFNPPPGTKVTEGSASDKPPSTPGAHSDKQSPAGAYDPATHKMLGFHNAVAQFRDGADTPRAYLERCIERIEALEPAAVPAPLAALLAHLRSAAGSVPASTS